MSGPFSVPLKLSTERLVDDLRWCLGEHPLVGTNPLPSQDSTVSTREGVDSGFDDVLYPSFSFWQRALRSAEPLLRDLSFITQLNERYEKELTRHRHGSLRLGLYFELLLGFWLEHGGHYDILAHHEAVRDARTGTTLGEVDWIIRHRESGQVEHWEAAVKFYLAYPQLRGLASFVGPSTKGRDSLHQKLTHMLGHQLRLTMSRPECVNMQRYCCLKGRLFVPWLPDWPHTSDWRSYVRFLIENPLSSQMQGIPEWLASLKGTSLAAGTPVGHWTTPEHVPPFVQLASANARAAGFLDKHASLSLRLLPKQLWMARLRAKEALQLPLWSPSESAKTEPQPFSLVLTSSESPDNKDDNPVVEWTRFFVVPCSHSLGNYRALVHAV